MVIDKMSCLLQIVEKAMEGLEVPDDVEICIELQEKLEEMQRQATKLLEELS